VPKSALSSIKFPGNNVTNIRKNPANIGCVAFDNVRHFSEDGRCRRMYMFYTLLRQFAKIFLLAIPSVRDARMWFVFVDVGGYDTVSFVFICLMLKKIYGIVALVSVTHQSPIHKRLEGSN
jgi:hypothetical protein